MPSIGDAEPTPSMGATAPRSSARRGGYHLLSKRLPWCSMRAVGFRSCHRYIPTFATFHTAQRNSFNMDNILDCGYIPHRAVLRC
ncbi:hypothetical protein HaLaN_08848, partial [Haematococcus lacustris]